MVTEVTEFSMCLVHADFRVVLILLYHGSEKFSPCRNKQAGLRARRSGIAGNPLVAIGISLLKDFDESLIGEDIDPAPARVVEKVVGATRDLAGRNLFGALRVKDEQSWRLPAAHEEAVMSFVERHGEV